MQSTLRKDELRVLCLFCRTGREQQVVGDLEKVYGIKAISPTRVLQEKRNRTWYTIERTLLPGYLFLFLPEEHYFSIREIHNAYRICTYGGNLRELYGSDLQYALWLYRYGGKIGISQIYDSGDVIQVTGGPLLDHLGTIVKVDKHKKKALVQFDFDGISRSLWLSFEWVQSHKPQPDTSAAPSCGRPREIGL